MNAPGHLRAVESFGVVGGGIVGLAVARELLRRFPGAKVTVFEKEERVATHQTAHNSGVVHAGIYYASGSLKASLCARGRTLLEDYCAEHGLGYAECGKLVVAVDQDELPRLDRLEATATNNGVPGVRRVSASEIRAIEPRAAGLAALHSPRTAITDYVAVADSLATDVVGAGGRVLLSTRVVGVSRVPGGIQVETSSGRSTVVEHLVACAGLDSDRVARLVGERGGPRIVPFRGDYLGVTTAKRDHVRGMVYPVPDPRYPFLGVHFTRRLSGELEVGPNALLSLTREGYGRRRGLSPKDVVEIAAWPGSWRMARHHWRAGIAELRGALSVEAYMRVASQYVPSITSSDVQWSRAGIRAQAVDADGALVDDFLITHGDRVTALRNAPSPAATSSLAIAEHVVPLMELSP